jgi:two-component system, chemotaxis family, CheB/CheR fusion protein
MQSKSKKETRTGDSAGKADDLDNQSAPSKDLLIAGIGASAGGLEAGTELVENLDPHSGMAYVFIPHLDPTHSSIIKDLLAKETSM